MRAGVSSRGSVWVSMGCLGWLLFGPFILAWSVLSALGQLAAEVFRAITGAVREARPEPDERTLERQVWRHRIAAIVILGACAAVAAAMVASAL